MAALRLASLWESRLAATTNTTTNATAANGDDSDAALWSPNATTLAASKPHRPHSPQTILDADAAHAVPAMADSDDAHATATTTTAAAALPRLHPATAARRVSADKPPIPPPRPSSTSMTTLDKLGRALAPDHDAGASAVWDDEDKGEDAQEGARTKRIHSMGKEMEAEEAAEAEQQEEELRRELLEEEEREREARRRLDELQRPLALHDTACPGLGDVSQRQYERELERLERAIQKMDEDIRTLRVTVRRQARQLADL